MSEKKPKMVNSSQKKQIARSPESFPDLNIYPHGWDLDPHPAQSVTRLQKGKGSKLATFPKTTDAML